MANSREEITRDLNDIIVQGLAENIRQTEEAIKLRESIGTHAGTACGGGYGHLFSRMQLMLERYAILLVTRLFEPPEEGYESISIPVALNYMRFHADYLEFHDRGSVLNKLISFGHEAKEFEGIPDPWITQLVRKEFADRLPNVKDSETNDIARALYNLKFRRDTSGTAVDTGPEQYSMKDSERNIKTLLIYARDFVETIGLGYLGVTFEDDTNLVGSQMKQLLIQADIVE